MRYNDDKEPYDCFMLPSGCNMGLSGGSTHCDGIGEEGMELQALSVLSVVVNELMNSNENKIACFSSIRDAKSSVF